MFNFLSAADKAEILGNIIMFTLVIGVPALSCRISDAVKRLRTRRKRRIGRIIIGRA